MSSVLRASSIVDNSRTEDEETEAGWTAGGVDLLRPVGPQRPPTIRRAELRAADGHSPKVSQPAAGAGTKVHTKRALSANGPSTSGERTKQPSSKLLRTRALLMDAAMRLVGSGHLPSVADLALHAGVSRATAYRYFPSRSKLISAVVEESLGPVRSFAPSSDDGLARVRELFDSTFPRFREFEPQLRAALQLALEHQAMERAGMLEEEPFRRGHRRRILSEAAAPLRPLLGKRRFDQLLKTMSLVYGIESYVVLKDIWGCSDREIARLARWMMGALIDTALREAGASAD